MVVIGAQCTLQMDSTSLGAPFCAEGRRAIRSVPFLSPDRLEHCKGPPGGVPAKGRTEGHQAFAANSGRSLLRPVVGGQARARTHVHAARTARRAGGADAARARAGLHPRARRSKAGSARAAGVSGRARMRRARGARSNGAGRASERASARGRVPAGRRSRSRDTRQHLSSARSARACWQTDAKGQDGVGGCLRRLSCACAIVRTSISLSSMYVLGGTLVASCSSLSFLCPSVRAEHLRAPAPLTHCFLGPCPRLRLGVRDPGLRPRS